MSGSKLGRPGSSLVANPARSRYLGAKRLRSRVSKYHVDVQRFKAYPAAYERPPSPPMEPTSDLDEGLVLASNAFVISPSSVRPILKKANEFAAWFDELPRARGPAADTGLAVRFLIAIKAAEAARKRRKKDVVRSTARELA